MATEDKIYRTKTRICIGAMNQPIQLLTRTIADKVGTVDFTENFTLFADSWAMVETTDGSTIFDESNIERTTTHNFYIRFLTGVTTDLWLKFDGRYFKILKVESINEDKSFLKLITTERGSSTVEVNWI